VPKRPHGSSRGRDSAIRPGPFACCTRDSVGDGDRLSPQERQVLALVAQGRTNKQVAVAMRISDKTVKNYLSKILQKLRVTRRAEAAVLFSSQRR
jgi:DNA-binding NarL/FixJ family response regulator